MNITSGQTSAQFFGGLWYLLILYATRVQKERVMDSPTMYITAFR